MDFSRKKRQLLFIFGILFLSIFLMDSPVFADGGATGVGSGGVGYVCRDVKGRIQSAYLLEFTEAEARHLMLPAFAKLKEVVLKLRSEPLQKKIMQEYDLLSTRIKKVPAKFPLPNPMDFTPEVEMPNCVLETIGLYDDVKNELRVNTDILKHLSPLHLEGFYAHEVFYKLARHYGAKNSNAVRRFVGELFSLDGNLNSLSSKELRFLSEDNMPHCEFYVDSIDLADDFIAGKSFRKIIFHLNAAGLGENVEDVGYIYYRKDTKGKITSFWQVQKATLEHRGIWSVPVSLPLQFSLTSLEIAFFAKIKNNKTLWINRENLPWYNFVIDTSTFYLLDGYARELSGDGEGQGPVRKIRSIANAVPPFVKQFQPLECK